MKENPVTTTKQVTSPEVIRTLSDSELDTVSGGSKTKTQENQEQLQALQTFAKALQKAGQI
jgi:hypothetical protein